MLLGIGIVGATKRTQARAVPEDSNERGVRRELEGSPARREPQAAVVDSSHRATRIPNPSRRVPT